MKIYNFTISTFQRRFSIVLLFLISIVYSFSGIFFGLDFTDSFYHLNQALYPANGIYLYPFFLSSIILKNIIELIGTEVINLRIINWLLLIFSMFLPFIFFRVRSSRTQILLYFSITLIFYAPFNANILGYDTLSIFILSLLYAVTALYVTTQKIYIGIALSFICAIAIFIRLPNVVAIPIIILSFFLTQESRKKDLRGKIILRSGAFILLTSLLVVAGYSLYYDNWEQFIIATSNSNSHNFLALIKNYVKDGIKLAGFLFLILAGWWIYEKLIIKTHPYLKAGICLLIIAICLSFFVGYTKFSVNYALFLVALVIAMVVIEISYTPRRKLQDEQLLLLLFLLYLFINPFGSNTGLLKAYSLLLLSPFVLSKLRIRNKTYWIILIMVLIPFSVVTKIYGVYEDKNFFLLKEKLEFDKLSSIHTNATRKNFLGETNAAVQQLKSQGVEIFFYGDKSHIFQYLYPESNLNIHSFFQPVDDPNIFEELDKSLQDYDRLALFIINAYPTNSTSQLELLEREMLNNGFQLVEKEFIKYYIRTTD